MNEEIKSLSDESLLGELFNQAHGDVDEWLAGHEESTTLKILREIDSRLTRGKGWERFLRDCEEPIDLRRRHEWFMAQEQVYKSFYARTNPGSVKAIFEEVA